MDDEELALLFSARQENEELREKLTRLTRFCAEAETTLNSKDTEIERLKGHINGLKVTYIPVYKQYDKMKAFLKLLDDYPMFWSISYKRSIRQFLIDNFPIKYGEIPER